MTSPRLATWLEQTWLECYLDRQLTREENAWFETYALDKPDLLAGISVDSALRDTMATYRALEPCVLAGDPATTANVGCDAVAASQMVEQSRASKLVHSWRRHFAAVAVVCAIGGLGIGSSGSWWLTREARPEVVGSPTRVIFDDVRGGTMTARIEHAGTESPYGLVEVALPAGATGITLDLGSGKVSSLSPAPDGFVSFLIKRELMNRTPAATINYTWRNRRMSLPLTLPKHGELTDQGRHGGRVIISDSDRFSATE